MTLDDSWIIPERTFPWLTWGFGTKHSVLPGEPASVKQIHGCSVITVAEPGIAGEADALITHKAGLFLGIKTADCLPVLMADINQHAVAAVHAGWRGTAKNIVGQAILEMEKKFKTKPIDLVVALGPAIGECCFEVGAEVAKEFINFNADFALVTGKCHLNLQAINIWQLQQAGVNPGNVFQNELCTVCGLDRFWSFRREREGAGRMWSVVGVER